MLVEVVFTVRGLIPVMRETVDVPTIDRKLIKEVLNQRLSEMYPGAAGADYTVARITSIVETGAAVSTAKV